MILARSVSAAMTLDKAEIYANWDRRVIEFRVQKSSIATALSKLLIYAIVDGTLEVDCFARRSRFHWGSLGS